MEPRVRERGARLRKTRADGIRGEEEVVDTRVPTDRGFA